MRTELLGWTVVFEILAIVTVLVAPSTAVRNLALLVCILGIAVVVVASFPTHHRNTTR